MPVLRRTALLASAALLVAACSSGDGGTNAAPASEASAAPALGTMDPAMAMPTVAPDAGAAAPSDAAGAASGSGGAAAGYNDPELEARLPDSVDGMTITKTSVSYASFPAEMAAQAFYGANSLGDTLKKEGKTWADVSFATAMTDELIATDPSMKTGLITAYRVKGASSAALLDWFGMSDNVKGSFEEKTVSGKKVRYYSIAGIDTGKSYVWAEGDALFWVMNANPAEFGEALVAAVK